MNQKDIPALRKIPLMLGDISAMKAAGPIFIFVPTPTFNVGKTSKHPIFPSTLSRQRGHKIFPSRGYCYYAPQTKKACNKALLPLFEAVMNSIYAIKELNSGMLAIIDIQAKTPLRKS